MSCFLGHKWKGCTCTKCGKVRDKNHDWSENCQKCAICGNSRQEAHNWQGCVCTKCKHTRDMDHNWKMDCEKCSVCGQTRDHYHKWDGCKCTKCGKTRNENHAWSSNCEKCSICGETRLDKHQWDGCVCLNCKQTREEYHDYDESGSKCLKCGHLSYEYSEYRKALTAFTEGNYNQAYGITKSILQITGSGITNRYIPAIRLRGDLSIMISKPDNAIYCYNLLIKLNKKDIILYNNLCVAQAIKYHFWEALESLSSGAQFQEKNSRVNQIAENNAGVVRHCMRLESASMVPQFTVSCDLEQRMFILEISSTRPFQHRFT